MFHLTLNTTLHWSERSFRDLYRLIHIMCELMTIDLLIENMNKWVGTIRLLDDKLYERLLIEFQQFQSSCSMPHWAENRRRRIRDWSVQSLVGVLTPLKDVVWFAHYWRVWAWLCLHLLWGDWFDNTCNSRWWVDTTGRFVSIEWLSAFAEWRTGGKSVQKGTGRNRLISFLYMRFEMTIIG